MAIQCVLASHDTRARDEVIMLKIEAEVMFIETSATYIVQTAICSAMRHWGYSAASAAADAGGARDLRHGHQTSGRKTQTERPPGIEAIGKRLRVPSL